MPLDAICLRALTAELQQSLAGARIDKVQQPARDQIVLLLRGNLRLLISANPNQPRLQLTEELRENPAEPPMFCMLLRKHLVGGRIVEIAQPGLERIVTITVKCTNELGEAGVKKLVLEAMGRRSNLLLLDEVGRILECLRRVEFEVSGARALLPGLFYQLPAGLDKVSLLEDEEQLLAPLQSVQEGSVERFLTDRYLGISPLIARELAFAATGESDARLELLGEEKIARIGEEIVKLSICVKQNSFAPYMLLRDGKPADFTYRSVAQYGTETEVVPFDSFSGLLDRFYSERERLEVAARRSQELRKAVTTARERMVRKLALLEREYAATQERDQLRLYGELITANMHRMERGAARLVADNYYDGSVVEIPLDPLLTPQQNAAKYYKRYNKAKTAEFHLRDQMEKTITERDYLESVLQEIALGRSEAEFGEIRRELQATGYLRRSGKEKKEKIKNLAPRTFRTSGGYRVYVGRSNIQNDELVRKADKRDLWLHTQKIHGSHVVVATGGEVLPREDLEEAAKLAAWFSQAQESANVPVDYTPVKAVKKPAGARPGMVVYESYRTVYVTPDAALAEKLKTGK